MAFRQCTNCGKIVSDKTDRCPKCGWSETEGSFYSEDEPQQQPQLEPEQEEDQTQAVFVQETEIPDIPEPDPEPAPQPLSEPAPTPEPITETSQQPEAAPQPQTVIDQPQPVVAPTMTAPASPAMKNCPYCGESIRAEAKKCRYCGEWLVDNPDQTTPVSQQPVVPVPPVPKQDDVTPPQPEDSGTIPPGATRTYSDPVVYSSGITNTLVFFGCAAYTLMAASLAFDFDITIGDFDVLSFITTAVELIFLGMMIPKLKSDGITKPAMGLIIAFMAISFIFDFIETGYVEESVVMFWALLYLILGAVVYGCLAANPYTRSIGGWWFAFIAFIVAVLIIGEVDPRAFRHRTALKLIMLGYIYIPLRLFRAFSVYLSTPFEESDPEIDEDFISENNSDY